MTEVRRYSVAGAGEGREDYAAPVLGPNAKEMRTESRSTTSNDSDPQPPPATPPLSISAAHYGKFFPRGCRGMIEEIQIYRTATMGGTITLRIAPHPCLGPLYQVVIPLGPANAWTSVALEQMWSYDSLFIWILTLGAGEFWGYDAVQPHDGHISLDGGATWADWAFRPFIRVIYSGETQGDVPVSGTINTIQIPNYSGRREERDMTLVTGVEGTLYEVHNVGYLDLIIFRVDAIAGSEQTEFRIYTDGNMAFNFALDDLNAWGVIANTPGVSLTAYAVGGLCVMVVTKLFEWRLWHGIRAFNPVANANVTAIWHPTYLR